MNNTSKALEKVYNGKNILTILPYPSYNKGAQWWTNKRLEKLYGIAASFFFKEKKSPSLIIVSKYKPIIEKDSYFLYISKYLIKDKNTVLISKSGKHYLYRSNNMINSNDLKLFGILLNIMKINQKIKKVAFIGMGLINSSLARDLKIKKFYLSSSAYSRRLSTINKIKKLKLVDFASSNIEKTIKEADIIIVGIPVAAYQEVFKKICNNIKPGAIITDVGSVKKEVINSVKKYIPKNIDFVPGHPIAGTENSGPESGFAGLFKNGWCILTPNKNTSKNSVKIIKYMWQLVGMKVDIMDSNYHDEVLAITSHIPHIIAYSIVGTIANLQTTIKKEVIKYAASGFRDFTRIAASDPIMWRDIILYNRQSILKMLNLFKKDLSKLEHAIENNDDKFLLNLFTKTRKIRKDIIK